MHVYIFVNKNSLHCRTKSRQGHVPRQSGVVESEWSGHIIMYDYKYNHAMSYRILNFLRLNCRKFKHTWETPIAKLLLSYFF